MRLMMKSKKLRALAILIFSMNILGCGNTNENVEVTNQQSEETNNLIDDAVNKSDEEIVESIKSMLCNTFDFKSETAVLGSAQKLHNVGCCEPNKIELVNNDNDVYIIKVTDINGNEYSFTIDSNGYIGPITDKNGKDLYTPID